MASVNALAQLRIIFPDETEQVVPVSQSPFNIGRVPANNLQLSHQSISRNHARLLFQGDEIVLIDLNSSNGTFVGEQQLGASEPYALSYGEPFRIGPYTLILEAAALAAKGPVPEAAPEAAETGEPLAVEEPQPEAPARITPAPPPPPPAATPPGPPEAAGPSHDEAFGLPPDRSRYLQYLPPIYHADPFVGRFLLAFEGLLAPIELTVGNFDLYLDPRTAPAFFLDQLAGWVGLTLDEKWPLEKRRAVLAKAAELYRRRGTRWSLARHLEIYTGITPEISEPEDQPFHFRVLLRVPRGQEVDRATVERIIVANKPTHTTFALEILRAK